MIMWVLWGERNSRVFRSLDRDPSETWFIVCFHVSLWASILKTFCSHSIGTIILSWRPFL